MAIDSKNLLVWVKAMSRGQGIPLDASEIQESLDAAKLYASSPIAYAGQTIKALVDGKYKSYILQPSEAGYQLEEIGSSSSGIKQYVVIDSSLPESDQEQGVLYINTTDKTGSIWNGSGYIQVFKDVQTELDPLKETVSNLESEMENKASLQNPTFTGKVTVNGDEIALKSYVDSLIANLNSSAPGVVDSNNPLPEKNYTAGQTFRVAEAGTYVNQKCEIGDLIIVLKDYELNTASDDDFMVVQANIDGAVTTTVDSVLNGELVVFDSVTGRVIKGSGLTISSLQETLEKVHEHVNKTQLDTYDKTQEELLSSAKTEAQNLVNTLKETVDKKADKGTTLEEYGITNAYSKEKIDSELDTIKNNLNTKVDVLTVDGKIDTAKGEILTSVEISIKESLEQRIGDIPNETTVKQYIDNAVGSGGTSSAEAIAEAKKEAIDTARTYTDEQLEKALTIVEF